jgi:hypothetical protein
VKVVAVIIEVGSEAERDALKRFDLILQERRVFGQSVNQAEKVRKPN